MWTSTWDQYNPDSRTVYISIIDKLNPLTNLKKHKGVTGAGVLFLALDTGRCLFQLRNSDKRHKNTWGFEEE